MVTEIPNWASLFVALCVAVIGWLLNTHRRRIDSVDRGMDLLGVNMGQVRTDVAALVAFRSAYKDSAEAADARLTRIEDKIDRLVEGLAKKVN